MLCGSSIQPKTVESSNYWHFGGNKLLLLTKNAHMKRCQKIGQGPPPPSFGKNPKEQLFFFGSPSRILICQTITVGAPGPRKSVECGGWACMVSFEFSVTADILPFPPACPAIHQPSLHCSESQGPSRWLWKGEESEILLNFNSKEPVKTTLTLLIVNLRGENPAPDGRRGYLGKPK